MPPSKGGRLRTLPSTFITPVLDPEEKQFLIDVFLQIARSQGLPKVDTKAMAEALGFKSAASANTAWYDLKRRLKDAVTDEGASTIAGPLFNAARSLLSTTGSRPGAAGSRPSAADIPNVKGRGKAKTKTAAAAAATTATTSAGPKRSGRKPNESEAPKTGGKEKRKRTLTQAEKVALILGEIDPLLLTRPYPGDNDISDGSNSE